MAKETLVRCKGCNRLAQRAAGSATDFCTRCASLQKAAALDDLPDSLLQPALEFATGVLSSESVSAPTSDPPSTDSGLPDSFTGGGGDFNGGGATGDF